MKSAFALVATLGLLWPAVALADPADCSSLLRRINHYEGMVERAERAGKDEWADKTQQHVDALEDRLGSRCPSYSDRDERQEIARHVATILKVAASAAVKIFTFGAY